MKKYIVLTCLSLVLSVLNPAVAQKPKGIQFAPEGFPDQLLEYMNSTTSDKNRQEENTTVLKAFKSVYNNFDSRMQDRLVAVYTYAVKAKMKGNPEICNLTRVLTAIATTPAGGEDVASAYGGIENLNGYLASLEAFAKKSAKAKAVAEYVDFCDRLISQRVLYHSNTSEWRFDPRTPFRLGVEKGVVLVWFDKPADLHYSSAKDQGVIRGTRGVYNYKENEWRGEGGRIDWARTGLGANDCYADLGHYTAETKFPKFKADSVQFVHTAYFTKPIPGRIEEALSNALEPEKYSYPRFRSYQRDFVIKDLLPEVDYSGSFMMNGSKFITASSKHPARLIFRHGGSERLVVTSLKFTITPTRMLAENAMVVLRLGEEDSIVNTGILVRYVPADKQVVLVNDSKRNYYSPYIDTYHSLDIYSESIVWRLESGEVLFSNLSSSGGTASATFESSNYYTYAKFREIAGIDEVSPVERVYDYQRSAGSDFSIDGFSNSLGLDRSQTLLLIHGLSKHGLVSYNEITGRVKVKDKLVDYRNAFYKRQGFDYDALTLESSAPGNNARLNLNNNELLIRGVERFVVSDSQYVVVYPDSLSGRQVAVGRDRSLHFSGRIDVGKFMITVKDCDFSYENFSFDMPHIERMEFYVPDFSDPGKYEQLVRTPLRNLVGSLDIDKPDNHCGLVKNKEYPIFRSKENSFVYYDSREIQGGQYVRDRFYYTLLPFTLNSMTDFVTDSLQFNGVLTSGGIFPDIKEPLRVQKDYYLGFQIETPASGLPAYGGKGQFTKKIRLNHNGLRGNGELTYLTSTSKSKDFLFLLDSTLALVDTVSVREEQGFPQISNGRANLHWYPKADSLALASVENGRPFRMYRGEASLRGRIDLMPKGATASGTANMREGSLTSTNFALAPREMNAAVSDFSLRSTKFNAIAFTARGVRSNVNYDTRRADLQAPEGLVHTDLQLPRYEAYADHFSWDMERKELSLANSTRGTSEGLDALDLRLRLPKAGDLPGVHFVSTDPARKQLAYHSLLSLYLYDRGELSSQGVYLLNVADAAIAPAADTLHISNGGEMRVLNKARVIFNRDSAYHYIVDADLIVNSADNYTGKGWYDYVSDQEKPQRLYLNAISVEQGVTKASGDVSDSASFTLSSAFGFAGKVRVEGNHRWPWFEGGVRLIQPCIPDAQLGLLAYADYTDPEHIHVTVPEQPTDWKGNRITASILRNIKTLQPQAAFLTNEKVNDNELLKAHGVLTYLGDHKQYMVASEKKVNDPDNIVEPYLTLSTTGCTVEGEGPVTFFPTDGTPVKIFAYGTASVGIQDDSEDHLATVFGFNCPIANEMVTAMANEIKENQITGFETSVNMRHALISLLGEEGSIKATTEYVNYGHLTEVPEGMRSTVLFDNIVWQYTPAMGYYFEGKVGLAAIGKEGLGLEVNLKARMNYKKHLRNNPVMTFYFQVSKSSNLYYFFSYDFAAKELSIYSNQGSWMDMIPASLEQRSIEQDGRRVFRYVGAKSSDVEKWLFDFERTLRPSDGD